MSVQSVPELRDVAKAWFFRLSAFAFIVVYPLLLGTSIVRQGRTASKCSDEADADASKVHRSNVSRLVSEAKALLALAVWPGICVLPIALTAGDAYRRIFPSAWYDDAPVLQQPGEQLFTKPLGLVLGITAVAVGQVVTICYHALRRFDYLGDTVKIQVKEKPYTFLKALASHLAQPEGFALIGGYLVSTWMLGLMPASYYSFSGGINWLHVAAQVLLQDLLQYLMHLGEHKVSSWVYAHSHKPHHRHTSPSLFNAFDGSITDTLLMIIVPFVFVARLVPANVWSYMTFGSLYANWLVLIHSEFSHPWDRVFRKIGFGTAADHHVHHRFFVFNYGHLFMYWDRLGRTYKSPEACVGVHFNKGI
mmetsp:Transcript_92151/g.160077  ORF Transcript_92151/g.160077 Transcript_92151/m.160077 type:complete len:363 (+) Transcript_92151:81-1169(+)